MHTVFALLCFFVVIHWLIFPYLSGLLHWHCGNLTIAPVPAKQPSWIWINTTFEFIMNDYITTTKQSTTKPCAYFLGYTVPNYSSELSTCKKICNTSFGVFPRLNKEIVLNIRRIRVAMVSWRVCEHIPYFLISVNISINLITIYDMCKEVFNLSNIL